MVTTAPRRQPQQPRAAVTVDAIVVAAERVLERQGAGGLTTNRVAEVAGVSIGSLYQYFPNKEALVAALVDRYLEQSAQAVIGVLAQHRDAPLEELAGRLVHALIATYRRQRPVHKELRQLRTVIGANERVDRALDTLVTVVAAFLRHRRELAIADPETVAFALVHAIDGVVNAMAQRAADDDALGKELARMVTGYLRPAGDTV